MSRMPSYILQGMLCSTKALLYNAHITSVPATCAVRQLQLGLDSGCTAFASGILTIRGLVSQMLIHWLPVQVLRVFHDRLISTEDKDVLQKKVTELVQRR